MVKIYFYNLQVEFLDYSHLNGQTFFEEVMNDLDADFLFISMTNQQPFLQRISEEETLKHKKIVLYNLTEPISFGAAQSFLITCLRRGIHSKNVFFHSTNHFLDQFNCLHKGLAITDHTIKSQLYTGYQPFEERFLKFSFLNNTIRTPRALVLNELLGRDINYNQCYVSANGDAHYGDRNINLYPNIKNKLDNLQSHDHNEVYFHTNYKSDKNFQSIYKNSFFGFTIETFSEFGLDIDGFNSHLTEKTIRNFSHKIPFLLLISSEYQIKIIEDLGFVLFNDLFNFNINLQDTQSTIKNYVDIIEKFSKMKSIDVKKLVMTSEYQSRIEKNYNQWIYYKNLNIENIYRYILLNEYEDRNLKLLEIKERELDYPVYNIISTDI